MSAESGGAEDEDDDLEEVLRLIAAQEADEEFARSLQYGESSDFDAAATREEEEEEAEEALHNAQQAADDNEEEADLLLCLQIQAAEEDTQRKLREMREREAELTLERIRREEEDREIEMIALALREHELRDFPQLGSSEASVATSSTPAATTTTTAEPSRHTSEIVQLLHQAYPSVPRDYIEHAAHEARGSLDAADTKIFAMYPQEYLAHKQMAAAQGGASSSASQVVRTEITKVKGRKLADIRTTTPDAAAATTPTTTSDPIREAYLRLAERKTYDADDLRRAYELWSTQVALRHAPSASSSSAPSRYRTTQHNYPPAPAYAHARGEERAMLDELHYHSARWDSAHIARQVRADEAFLAHLDTILDNASSTDTTTRDHLCAKIAHGKRELLAAQREAADLLFVSKNPQLWRMATQRSSNTGTRGGGALVVDLHTMHVHEAVDRVRATLQCAARHDWGEVKIITGKGKHSANLEARLGPEIRAYLEAGDRVVAQAVDRVKQIEGGVLVSLRNWKERSSTTSTGGEQV